MLIQDTHCVTFGMGGQCHVTMPYCVKSFHLCGTAESDRLHLSASGMFHAQVINVVPEKYTSP